MRNNKKGFIAVVAIFLIVVVTLAVMPLIMSTYDSSRPEGSRVLNYYQSINELEKALYIAEGGLKYYAQRQLKSDDDWSNNAGIGPVSFGGGTFTIAVVGPSPRQAGIIEIASTGAVQVGTSVFTRKVQALIRRQSPFNCAAGAEGDQGITVGLSGQATTDSYDSSIGPYGGSNVGTNGDVWTNGDISVTGLAYIGGDAITGASGTFDNQAAVAGTISHDSDVTLSLITVPTSLTSLPSEGNLNTSQTISGDHKYSAITLAGQKNVIILGPSNIYVTGDISTSGQAKITVSDTSTGPVIVYLDNDASLSGQGIVNSTLIPANFQLYGTGTNQSITLSGQAAQYAAVYAPDGEITLSGQGALYGSFIGEGVNISGQGGIHYDEALMNISLPGGGGGSMVMEQWREIIVIN